MEVLTGSGQGCPRACPNDEASHVHGWPRACLLSSAPLAMGRPFQTTRALRSFITVLILSGGLCGEAATAEDQTPDTRQEEWARLRRQKAESSCRRSPGFLERKILAIEKAERPSLLDFNLGGFYPRLQSIGWGSQMAAGRAVLAAGHRGLEARRARGGLLFAAALRELRAAGGLPARTAAARCRRRSTVRRRRVRAGRQRAGAAASKALGYASLRYHHLPEVDFYGLGNDTSAGGPHDVPAAGRLVRPRRSAYQPPPSA